ncbi:Alg9-like mannosyltransferase family-domain-containing protein [Scheffersomyces coipomensis]|uniref:Alg9-like mannosyltransferase family-domain-containing protein n=1 Tax=Scheffersomyces coipomensis TaxID=1788519 RepID=UPI00315C4EB3
MVIKAKPKDKGNVSLTTLQYAIIALNITIRIYSSLYMIISDCDETFNYWEPLNLLFRKFGKQTWEYSPEFAIRDYVYLLIYYTVGLPILVILKWFSQNNELTYTVTYYQFYFLRLIALNGFTSFGEIYLFKTLNNHLTPSIANWFLFFNSIAPGMSHAGVALLPSTLAMQTNMISMGSSILAFSSWSSGVKSGSVNLFVGAIIWILIGGLLGWPFSLALGIPLGFYIIFNYKFYQSSTILDKPIFQIIFKSLIALILISGGDVLINTYYYKKPIFVPLNIVLYNVFGGEGEGPEIFGVEPFSYYILNLLLNFNITAILGYGGTILNPLIYQSKKSLILIVFSLPVLVWTGIFFSQPHKEERFLYPIYPLISINASLLIIKLFGFSNQILSIFINENYSIKLNRLVKYIFITLIFLISTLRIINLVDNYATPLNIFSLISQEPQDNDEKDVLYNVCIGREWYHYPNSFFLPDNYRLRFVQSGFDGLLPGDFSEIGNINDITSSIPIGMNNKNQFDIHKIINFNDCDYYIDNSGITNDFEPTILADVKNGDIENWKVLGCEKLINPEGAHSGIGKFIYIPTVLRSIIPHNVEYMDLCALKKDKESL